MSSRKPAVFQPTPQQVQAICDQVYEVAEVLVSANYFVVEVAFELAHDRWHLRIYLDHPNPAVRVTLEDCKDISEALGPMIDEAVEPLKTVSYVLEVSSPGMFRVLKQPRELQFYRGRRIEIRSKSHKPFIAYLAGFDREAQALAYCLTPEDTAAIHTLPWETPKLQVSLSPDLTQKVDVKPVPRRITGYD